MACNLRAGRPGGIDRLAGLQWGCGLNSRQIKHLQRIASETHYRVQSLHLAAEGSIGGGGLE